MAKLDEEHAVLLLEGIKAVFAPEFARIDEKFGYFEAKIEAKIESVARDQLFKIVALFLSTAAATIGAVVLAISLSR